MIKDRDFSIRREREEDFTAVSIVHEAAFGRAEEARLVAALRQADLPLISLVAVRRTAVIAHILFSPVSLVSPEGTAWDAVALGPLAVLPGWQHQGVGAALIQEGLLACRTAGYRFVFVLGHATYYPRFGFVPTRPYGITCEFDVPEEAFMVNILEKNALAGVSGVVHYRPEFHGV